MAKFTRTNVVTASEETAGADIFERLQQRVQEIREKFRHQDVTPVATYQLEKDLKTALDQAGREILEEELNHLEPADKQQAAPRIRYHKATYRINKRTRAKIATSFGDIAVWSYYYLNEENGEPGLHPLHVRLGIVADTTPVLAERAARWAVDHSQREVRELLAAEHGLHWSNDRLRRVLREFRRLVVAYRAEAQAERLLKWLTEAERSRGRNRPVLAVGRDGVMVPMRKGGAYQEASAGTVSIYDRRRKRLGTVYLGQMPESHQLTMTEELTSLVKAVLLAWTGPEPRLVYVTDKGQAQDEYYRSVLKRMPHPRKPQQRLEWEWVLDYFHAAGYVGKLSEALFGKSTKEGQRWFGRMRHWLRDRDHGVTQILRSAMQHFDRRQLTKAEEEEYWKAYLYLRKHSRLMGYARHRRYGLPIGSGVTEAACKTVFTQRIKRSGMRWGNEFGQIIVDLRVIYLSGIWSDVVSRELQARPQPQTIERTGSYKPQTLTMSKKAA
jgi:type II secretory pathway component PulJ